MITLNLSAIWQAFTGLAPYTQPEQWFMLNLVGLAIPIAAFMAILGIGMAAVNWCLRNGLGRRIGGRFASWVSRQFGVLVKWTAAVVVGWIILPYAGPILALLGLVWLMRRLVREQRRSSGRPRPRTSGP